LNNLFGNLEIFSDNVLVAILATTASESHHLPARNIIFEKTVEILTKRHGKIKAKSILTL
jgi:hypothetical protein